MACMVHILHLIYTQHNKTGVKNCTKPMRKLGVKKVLVTESNCQDQSKPDSKSYMLDPNTELLCPLWQPGRSGVTLEGQRARVSASVTAETAAQRRTGGQSQSPVRYELSVSS